MPEAITVLSGLGLFLLGLKGVLLVVMALRGTEPKDRPGILRAMRGSSDEKSARPAEHEVEAIERSLAKDKEPDKAT